jgi:hypothetical protein
LWAPVRVCIGGDSGEVELCIWIDEAPEPEKMTSDDVARAKISVGWAWSIVWVVRYCFDCVGVFVRL